MGTISKSSMFQYRYENQHVSVTQTTNVYSPNNAETRYTLQFGDDFVHLDSSDMDKLFDIMSYMVKNMGDKRF